MVIVIGSGKGVRAVLIPKKNDLQGWVHGPVFEECTMPFAYINAGKSWILIVYYYVKDF